MLKLAYDYQIFVTQRYGGISRYFYELINYFLLDESFQTSILVPLYVNDYLKEIQSRSVIGCPIPSIPKTWRLRKKLSFILSKMWFSHHMPDILHETYYHPKRLAPKPTKCVVTIHDMIHEKFSHLFPPGDEVSSAKKESVIRADHVICVSENTKRDLIEVWNVDSSKISVIYHGCSLSNFNNQESNKAEALQPYILYVGSREGYKNFENLLKAYASSDNLRNNFNLVCFGSTSLSSCEKNLINDLKIPPGKVIPITGSDSVLARLYKEASIFVYPSWYEGFGMPLLEAMALQCPVACSNTSCIPEIASNAAEFFNPYDFEDIANAIEKVIFSTNRTQQLITLGRERAKTFSWSACAEQTKAVYLSLE